MTDANLFWERLDGESDTAYQAFCTYRDMGITRSLRKAAAKFYGDQEEAAGSPETGTSGQVARFKEWSRNWLWVSRAEAFDAEESRERSLRMKEKRQKLAEQHFAIGTLAMNRAAERLQKLGFEEEIPLKSVPSLIRAAADLQRLAVGEPTRIEDVRTRPPEQDDEGDWTEGRTVEDLEEIARLSGLLQDDTEIPDGLHDDEEI